MAFKHGMKGTPEYNSWRGMRARCYQKNHKNYDDYGGRGITICKRWDSFSNFLNDMGERPKGETLDRIDNSGGYEPSNCRWATQSEQMVNTRLKSTNKSGYRGVSFRLDRAHRPNPWAAQICRNQKVKHLGFFNTAKEASEIYQEATARCSYATIL